MYTIKYELDGVSYEDEFDDEFSYLNRLYSLSDTKGTTIL